MNEINTHKHIHLRRILRKIRQQLYPIPVLAKRYIRIVGYQFGTLLPQQVTCLDLGAGVTPYRSEMENCFDIGRYIAFDIAASDVITVVGDAEVLPFKSSSINLILSMDTLQHIPNPNSVLDEIQRVLAPGGLVILSFPFSYGECDVMDYHRWSLQGMQHELKRRGMVILDVRRRGGMFFSFACAMQWALQHMIPGGRSSWRSLITPLVVLRSLAIQIIILPAIILCWIMLVVDALLPVSGLYMGGLIVARSP